MHLRSLSLVGFKSFADRTRLVFEPGVTVVVGPNGSGKSNLVDAVAWVMGTQAVKSLRTEKMEDVIFAGTALRPSLGRADVRITLDNSDGRVPLDLPEVTITRRLYRDGTSQYEINGTGCRLLDIQELLSDSGIGRHQHIIVGQGRVDAVLNAGPEEHRAIIEEAAGVIKHRQRRDRAMRRLDATEIDVRRLEDLLGEQQRRMRPLRRQARAYERHAETKQRWQALRLWVGGEELRRTRERIEGTDSRLGSGRERLSTLEAESVAVREALVAAKRAWDDARSMLERDTAAAARLETSAERFRRIAMVARERGRAIADRLEGDVERRADLEREAAELDARIGEARSEEASAAEAAERRESALRSLDDEERSLADRRLLPPEGILASARGDLAALEAAERRDAAEADEIERRMEVLRGRIDEEAREIERLRDEIREADASQGPAQERYRDIVVERETAQRFLEEAEAASAASHTDAAAARARLDAFEAAVAGTADPGLRERAAALEPVIDGLVSLLDVPEPLAAAVDAALGDWSDALVVGSPEGLAAAVAAIKTGGEGGVGFVAAPLDAPAPARKVAAAAGVDPLVDLLGPAADGDLAAAVLGDVVFVEGWQTGWALLRRHPEVRAVTPEGDLITACGIRVVHPDGAGRAAVEAAAVALERAETDVARALSRLRSARRDFAAIRERERDALEAVEAVETRIAGAAEALRLVGRSRAELEAEVSRLESRGTAVGTARTGRAERIAEVRRRIGGLEGGEAQTVWEELQARRSDVAERRDHARRMREEAAAALAAVEERRRLMERRRAQITSLIAGTGGGEIPDPAEVERLGAVETRARRAVEAVTAHLAVLRERQRSLRDRVDEARREVAETEQARDGLDAELTALREELSSLAVEAAELRVREEAAAEGLRRDVDASEDEALAAGRPEIDEGTDPLEQLASLEAALRRLGQVNPLAAAEYRELSERAEFLQTQLDDLEASRRELRTVIGALDGEIARLFREAFGDIAAAFEQNFTVLFPGGAGKLLLTDPDDPLQSGVEIHARPLGKKVGALSLLSGGERSLAALAFLFAVFRARPSPFYLLDEVDAALDDANLRRFIRLLGTLRETSQLIVVTHQQQTMEAADLLYGVTMEPGESSRVLATRLAKVPARS